MADPRAGLVRLDYTYEDGSAGGNGIVGSGTCFDLRLLNIGGVFIGFPNDFFQASALTKALLFIISLDGLVDMLENNPHLLHFVRCYALTQLAHQNTLSNTSTGKLQPVSLDAFGQLEDADWCTGARSRDFEPLRPAELDSMKLSLASVGRWFVRSLAPTVEPGCRHQCNPLSGSLAQMSVRSKSRHGMMDLLTRHASRGAPHLSESAQAEPSSGEQPREVAVLA